MEFKAKAYLSLGSNLGDRREQLREAVRLLEEHGDSKVTKASSVYETEPVGDVPQDNFYNIVIEIDTALLPWELLMRAQAIEKRLRRKREVRWGPRTIDVDILLYGNTVVDEKGLTVPHAEMHKRAFVLVPLLEIAPGVRFPDGKWVRGYLEEVSEQVVKKIGSLI